MPPIHPLKVAQALTVLDRQDFNLITCARRPLLNNWIAPPLYEHQVRFTPRNSFAFDAATQTIHLSGDAIHVLRNEWAPQGRVWHTCLDRDRSLIVSFPHAAHAVEFALMFADDQAE